MRRDEESGSGGETEVEEEQDDDDTRSQASSTSSLTSSSLMPSRETPSQDQAAAATAAPPAVVSMDAPAKPKVSTIKRWLPGAAAPAPAATAPAAVVPAVADMARRPDDQSATTPPPIESSFYDMMNAPATPKASITKGSTLKRWSPGAAVEAPAAPAAAAASASAPASTTPPIDDERRSSSPGPQSNLDDTSTVKAKASTIKRWSPGAAVAAPAAAAAHNIVGKGNGSSNQPSAETTTASREPEAASTPMHPAEAAHDAKRSEQQEIASRLHRSNEQLKTALMAARERESSLEARLVALEARRGVGDHSRTRLARP